MKPLLRVGRKKLGITPEIMTGRPLFILNEIYTTEKTYVKNLEALVYVYQEPMKVICNYEDGFLSKQSIHIIFQHLKRNYPFIQILIQLSLFSHTQSAPKAAECDAD
jgi:hypothetical protein